MEEQQQIISTDPQSPEVYPLDEATVKMLAEMAQQEYGIQMSRSAVLNLFARQHKLDGKWQLAPNGEELVKAAT